MEDRQIARLGVRSDVKEEEKGWMLAQGTHFTPSLSDTKIWRRAQIALSRLRLVTRDFSTYNMSESFSLVASPRQSSRVAEVYRIAKPCSQSVLCNGLHVETGGQSLASTRIPLINVIIKLRERLYFPQPMEACISTLSAPVARFPNNS